MKKTFFLSLITLFVMSSCVSKKEYTSLENRHKKTQDLLNTATVKLNSCLEELSTAEALSEAYKEQLSDLKRRNDQLFIQSQDYLELTAKGAENLDDPRKIERLKQWCKDVSQSTGKIYKYLYVKQEDWDSLGLTPNSFEEIIPIFKEKNS